MNNKLYAFNQRHDFLPKLSASLAYALAVSLALNIFWQPGHIYSSGITGFAQIVNTLSERFLPFTLSTSAMYVVLNIPPFIWGWFKIGPKFTFYTIIAVVLGALMMHWFAAIRLSLGHIDPVLCAIFGAAINGAGTGICLRSGVATGGLDIVGIIVREKTGTSFGKVNIAINLVIVIIAGFVFGWIRALYTALNIFINGQIIDIIYNRHEKLEVMIVTTQPKHIIDGIQKKMHRGITILHDVEGAYAHEEKTVLITIIDHADLHEINRTIFACDENAFVSVSQVMHVYGRFKEQGIV
ncbi:MAG: YitT family protein [Lactobacillus sp.]